MDANRFAAAGLALALAGAAASAEQADSDTPQVSIRSVRVSDGGLDGPAGAGITATEWQASAVLAAMAIAGGTLGFGLDYQYTRYEYEGIAGRDRDLHRLHLPMRFRRSRDGTELAVLVAPGIATSSNVMKDAFRRATSEDLFVTGAIRVRREITSSLAWEAGVAHDRSLGEPTLYPLIGLSGGRERSLRWRLAYPESAATWQPSERTALSVRAYPAGAEWHVLSDDFASEFTYRVRAVRAELTLSRRIGRGVSVDISAGFEVDRKHDFVDGGGVRIDAGAADRPVLSIGLRYGGRAPAHPNTPRP